MVKKIGILGPGTMGASIGYLAASSGFYSVIYGRSEDSIKRGKARVEKIIEAGQKRGRITEETAGKIREKIEYVTDLNYLASCDIIIESVAEDIEIKKDFFRRLDSICGASVILATNTSTKSVTELASVCSKPHRFIGMHFFNPAHIMRLVEVIRAVQTSDETVSVVSELAQKLGKVPVIIKDYPGFIVNHLLVPLLNHAIEMLESGVSSEDLKKVATLGLGHPMGPIELADFIGLDVVEAMGDTLYEYFRKQKFVPPVALRNLVKAGLLGVKTKKGFLDYDSKK
ncbi:MAG: 3-hydroxyacyl-CoA dehydrogenase family protein [bacterium]|nr:3-hydroxyacyl-CoA dehydrogenase family protein [bacterium]MDW8087521.1 3-hydroxyacyl-CoA dehydrogenase family protein [Candidatus Calescibacterium sp.]